MDEKQVAGLTEFGILPVNGNELSFSQETLSKPEPQEKPAQSYYNTVQSLEDLKEKPEFQDDLIRFFNGGRYNMTPQEIEEAGVDGLYDKYVDHMRFQEVNEATALKDLFYVKDSNNQPREDIESFGRLVNSWDHLGGVGDSFFAKVKDYGAATVSSPSFVAGLAAAGVGGPVSKLSSMAANKATQLTLRQALSKYAAKEIAKNGLTRAAVVGAGRGAATEGAIGFGHETVLDKVRDKSIDDYETDPYQFWTAVGIQSVVGGVAGGLSRTQTMHAQNKAIEVIQGHHKVWEQTEKRARAKTKSVLKAAEGTPEAEEMADQMARLVDIKESFNSKVALDPLDPEVVARGTEIKKQILSGDGEDVRAGMSMSDLQKLAAAGMDLSTKLDRKKGERITAALGRAIESGTLDDTLTAVKKDYNLTNSQLRDLFLADVSEAGRILKQQSDLSKELKKAGMASIDQQIKSLAKQGVPVPGEDAMAKVAKAMDAEGYSGASMLRELDSMRIGFLTSQPATTVANFLSQNVRLGVDASDQVFKNVIRSVQTKGAINPLRGAFSGIRNTFFSENAQALRMLTQEQAPDLARKIYFDASRVENATGGQSRMAKLTRTINFFNTSVDAVFKQGIFFSSLDRQLMELNNPKLGRNALEFLKNGSSFDDLPEEVLKRVETDTLGFVYQKGFKGEKNLFGKAADSVITVHKEVPFTVSTVVPFPRYIANQLEFVHDYTPFVGLIGMGLDAMQRASGKGARTATKDMSDRMARQATGVMAMMSAYYIRSTQNGETEPLHITGDDGANVSIERAGGPHNTHLIMMDALYRQQNGLPVPELTDTVMAAIEAASGMNLEGYGSNVSTELLTSLQQGEWTDGFNRWAGDLASTFTFPLAIVNDVLGQFNPDRAAKPYTRDLFGDNDFSIFGAIQIDAEATNRATRFLWDDKTIQYTQSFDGETDVPLFNPFNDKGPVRTLNPLLKQVTSAERKPALSSLQREMNRLNMKEWDVYGSRKVENASVDEVVRRQLSETLPQKFLAWSKKDVYKKTTDPDQKKVLLRTWLLDQINEEQAKAENAFMALAHAKPQLASGFIRNQFDLKQKDAQMEFDKVVSIYTEGEFSTVDEYLYSGEYEGEDAIRQEIVRRMEIMNWSAREESVFNKAK